MKSVESRLRGEGESGGDSHLEISVIPVLGHSLYTCKYSHGARAWQGLVAMHQCKGGHIKADVKWQRWVV